jgi:hypothetical protein
MHLPSSNITYSSGTWPISSMIYRDNSFSSSSHTANLIKSNEIPKHITKPHQIPQIPPKPMGIPGSQNGGTVPYKAIFCGDIPLHRPYIGLIYGRYTSNLGSWNGHWLNRSKWYEYIFFLSVPVPGAGTQKMYIMNGAVSPLKPIKSTIEPPWKIIKKIQNPLKTHQTTIKIHKIPKK